MIAGEAAVDGDEEIVHGGKGVEAQAASTSGISSIALLGERQRWRGWEGEWQSAKLGVLMCSLWVSFSWPMLLALPQLCLPDAH